MEKQPAPTAQKIESVMRKQTNWKNLWFYQKTVVLYQLTYVFTRRFLPGYGDRTVDQMVQAARSGKQNIVEGSADGVTSMEMELKLLNVARSSIQELQEDYEDYLTAHHLTPWTQGHPRFDPMMRYCRTHNFTSDYEPYFVRWTDEEAANIAITLCRMVDRMLMTYQKKKENEFVTEGGIRERMTAARLGFRTNQRETIDQLNHELDTLRQENDVLKNRIREIETKGAFS
jgi:four helix bundle suffix protein